MHTCRRDGERQKSHEDIDDGKSSKVRLALSVLTLVESMLAQLQTAPGISQ